jgi:hypothetical protein
MQNFQMLVFHQYQKITFINFTIDLIKVFDTWRQGLSGREPASQMQGTEFKPQSTQVFEKRERGAGG